LGRKVVDDCLRPAGGEYGGGGGVERGDGIVKMERYYNTRARGGVPEEFEGVGWGGWEGEEVGGGGGGDGRKQREKAKADAENRVKLADKLRGGGGIGGSGGGGGGGGELGGGEGEKKEESKKEESKRRVSGAVSCNVLQGVAGCCSVL